MPKPNGPSGMQRDAIMPSPAVLQASPAPWGPPGEEGDVGVVESVQWTQAHKQPARHRGRGCAVQQWFLSLLL